MLHKLLRNISKMHMLSCLITIFIWTLCNCLFVEVNASLVVSILNQKEDMSVQILKYVFLIGFWCITEYATDICSDALHAHIECVTFRDGFNNTYNTKPEVLKNVNAGYVTGLLRTLQSKRAELLYFVLCEGIMCIIYLGYFTIRIGRYHWMFGVILMSVVVIGSTIRILGRRLMSPITNKLVESDSVVTKTFIDIVTNINTVQKMQANKFMSGKIDSSLNDYYHYTIKNIKANDIFYCVFKFVNYMFVPLCLMLTYAYDFDFDRVEFYALLSPLSVQLVHMTKNVAGFFKRLDLYVSAQKKVDNIINDDTVNKAELIHNFDSIDIRDADYTYKHNVTKNTVHVQIPFISIRRGDKVCIYGESGQGKTTTLNILSRQLETNNVYIDGKQTTDRINCVFISQDTEIFDMSVRDNLTLGNTNISDNELLSMLDSVGLKEWIDSQEKGLDTLLGERGIFVSTGQRQRLNLIRGLLIQDKDLYLLDEPTSNVDEFTEKKMVDLINNKLSNKTFVIVSHRKAIAGICTRFYKFENGICGIGTSSFNA